MGEKRDDEKETVKGVEGSSMKECFGVRDGRTEAHAQTRVLLRTHPPLLRRGEGRNFVVPTLASVAPDVVCFRHFLGAGCCARSFCAFHAGTFTQTAVSPSPSLCERPQQFIFPGVGRPFHHIHVDAGCLHMHAHALYNA